MMHGHIISSLIWWLKIENRWLLEDDFLSVVQ
ncbi:hypothetical protein V6Z11_A03G095700 [Gossypium hirsutum]